jgi:microcystin-dependent protein
MAINKSYTFTNNTIADPAEVNQNFDDLIAAIRAAHHRDADGTKISYQDIATGWGLVPSKGIIMYNDTIANIPTGYVFCNGANSTPDLRNKFVLCPGQDDGGTYDTGDTGGAATHQLLESEMPSHTHVQNAHTHTQDAHAHNIYCQFGADGQNRRPESGDGNYAGTGESHGAVDASVATNQNTTATNQNTGGGGAHNNMPPFKALVFIMKT